jgi:hypothetical protein
MAISMEDMQTIRNELDDRYVMQSDCNERQEAVNRKFANDDKRIEQNERFNESLKKFMWIAVTALAGEVILSFVSLFKGGF